MGTLAPLLASFWSALCSDLTRDGNALHGFRYTNDVKTRSVTASRAEQGPRHGVGSLQGQPIWTSKRLTRIHATFVINLNQCHQFTHAISLDTSAMFLIVHTYLSYPIRFKPVIIIATRISQVQVHTEAQSVNGPSQINRQLQSKRSEAQELSCKLLPRTKSNHRCCFLLSFHSILVLL